MAKRARSRKRVSFGAAVKALRSAGVPHQEFGRVNADGTHKVQPAQLERLKKRLGRSGRGHIRFVALNAPFKRRSPVAPA
jgi:hypothetical protein